MSTLVMLTDFNQSHPNCFKTSYLLQHLIVDKSLKVK